MPKKVIYTRWACNLCHQEHETNKTARSCEKRGVAIPPFKKWDLALLNLGDVQDIIGVVTSYGPDEGHPNPHLLPGYYNVNVAYRDYNPENYQPPGNNPLRRYGITVSHDMMKPHIISDATACPLCQSKDIRCEVDKMYSPFCCLILFNFMIDIEISKCGNCGLYFFSKKQSTVVDKKIRAKLEAELGEMGLASTKNS